MYSNTASKQQKEKQQQFFGPKRNIQRIFWPVKRVQAATAVGWIPTSIYIRYPMEIMKMERHFSTLQRRLEK